MDGTITKPLCRNGDGKEVHAQDRCKDCYERAMACGAIVAGDGSRVVSLAPWSPDWTALALCGNSDPEAWFPEGDDDPGVPKRVCARCPVRGECLDAALAMDPAPYGIWAGTDEAERAGLRRVAAGRAA